MFRAKTVLVIGAGASFELGLPLGPALLNQIVGLTHLVDGAFSRPAGDRQILAALKILLKGDDDTRFREHLLAGKRLGASARLASSIDNLIENLENPQITLVGKLGIVRSILMAEAASAERQINQDNPEVLEISSFAKTWYSGLANLLTTDIRKSQIDRIFDNLEIINFNYDRCLEHYLPLAIAETYQVPAGAVRTIMQSLPIHRPYGVVGRLPWQKGSGPGVGFGKCSPELLAEIAPQIRTFTETVAESKELSSIRSGITNADRVVFLGFAFHRQNIRLLAQKMQHHCEIWGTTFGISASDVTIIENELAAAFGHELNLTDPRIQLADMKCAAFFKEYGRTLTAEKGHHEPFALSDLTRSIPEITAHELIDHRFTRIPDSEEPEAFLLEHGDF